MAASQQSKGRWFDSGSSDIFLLFSFISLFQSYFIASSIFLLSTILFQQFNDETNTSYLYYFIEHVLNNRLNFLFCMTQPTIESTHYHYGKMGAEQEYCVVEPYIVG